MVVDLFDRGSLRVFLQKLDGLLDSGGKLLLVGGLELVAVLRELLLQTIRITLKSVLGSGTLLDLLV